MSLNGPFSDEERTAQEEGLESSGMSLGILYLLNRVNIL